MKDFFADYWLWMAIPFAVVLAALAFLYFWADGSAGASPFVYDLGGG